MDSWVIWTGKKKIDSSNIRRKWISKIFLTSRNDWSNFQIWTKFFRSTLTLQLTVRTKLDKRSVCSWYFLLCDFTKFFLLLHLGKIDPLFKYLDKMELWSSFSALSERFDLFWAWKDSKGWLDTHSWVFFLFFFGVYSAARVAWSILRWRVYCTVTFSVKEHGNMSIWDIQDVESWTLQLFAIFGFT